MGQRKPPACFCRDSSSPHVTLGASPFARSVLAARVGLDAVVQTVDWWLCLSWRTTGVIGNPI